MQDYLSDLYRKLSGNMKLGRERSEALMEHMDHPERAFRSVHVAGTNGKGTVTAVTASLLEAAGLKTGRFTSPHLVRFNERITVNGEAVPDLYVQRFLKRWDPVLKETAASFFEVTTALGFCYFRDRQADAAVIETGLGGRLDATSVIIPEISVITRIGYDHTEILGETLPLIAAEKAGIIKQGVPVITCPQGPGVTEVLKRHSDRLSVIDPEAVFSDVRLLPEGMRFGMKRFGGSFLISLPGRHQLANIALAFAAAEHLLGRPLSRDETETGLASVVWKGRFEHLGTRPDVIYDVAHNPEGIRAFCETAAEMYPEKKYYVVLGVLKDKHPEEILNILFGFTDKIWVSPVRSHRSIDEEDLRHFRNVFPRLKTAATVTEACTRAAAELPDDAVLCILGSHYIAEEVYGWNSNRQKKPGA